MKKRLKEVQKRESEFTTATRAQISKDFCFGQTTLFRERMRLYERSKDIVLSAGEERRCNETSLALFKDQEEELRQLIMSFHNFMTGSSMDSFE